MIEIHIQGEQFNAQGALQDDLRFMAVLLLGQTAQGIARSAAPQEGLIRKAGIGIEDAHLPTPAGLFDGQVADQKRLLQAAVIPGHRHYPGSPFVLSGGRRLIGWILFFMR
jgi:hypothetical protein